MQQFRLPSFDDTEIFVTIWDDVSMPCGVVQLLHGMSEYAGRYDEFARYLNSRGYIVFADDHRGHGRTETPENRGRHKGNIFKKTLCDELYFYEWLKDKYKLPVFLAGQSCGSFLCQAIAQQKTDIKAIALLGSGHMHGLFTLGKIALAPIRLIAGQWRPNLSKHDEWINSVPERMAEMRADENVNIPMSVAFSFSMMRETSKLYGHAARGRLNPMTSIALFSGTDDAVGQKGKGVKKLYKMYKSTGINCELHMYEGARHDIVFEYCEKQVQRDIADFFDKFVMYEQPSLYELVNASNSTDGEDVE
ncbi:MAG: alpha/beta hydrolase [Clostridia bacterium]|nr:alpha/beta hydrolase [Clostridia bacterium]